MVWEGDEWGAIIVINLEGEVNLVLVSLHKNPRDVTVDSHKDDPSSLSQTYTEFKPWPKPCQKDLKDRV